MLGLQFAEIIETEIIEIHHGKGFEAKSPATLQYVGRRSDGLVSLAVKRGPSARRPAVINSSSPAVRHRSTIFICFYYP